ncbi:MAG: hypothetical protein ACKOCM_02025 [Cyanobacteriota bacterium]
MTTKPSRRGSTALTRTTGSSSSFWGTLASYASELATVAGPLLEAIGQTANAIERAERRNRLLEAGWEEEGPG